MELRHLRYFLAVAEELHFGRAARRIGIAQPPLSRQIGALEAELGVRLFARSGRRVHLTDAGRVLLGEARTSLAHVDRAAERARRAGREESGRLAVGFSPAAELALVGRLVPPFLAQHPAVQIELHAIDPEDHVEALHAGTIEAAILPVPARGPNGITVERLLSVEICAALPRRHRLATRARLTLAMLADEPLVLLRPEAAPRLHDAVQTLLRKAGVAPRVRCLGSQLATCLALVAAGLGIGLLPAAPGDARTAGVVSRRIAGPAARLELALVYRRDDASEILRAFVASVRRAIASSRVRVIACGAGAAAG